MPTWKGFQDARKERVHLLLRYITDNTGEDKELDADKLVLLFNWKWGVSPAKVREYLGELRSLGAIKGVKTVKATEFAKKLLKI